MFWLLLVQIIIVNLYLYFHYSKRSKQKIQSILDTPEIVSEIKEIVRNHNDSKIVLKLMRDKYFLNTKEAILVLKRIKEEKK